MERFRKLLLGETKVGFLRVVLHSGKSSLENFGRLGRFLKFMAVLRTPTGLEGVSNGEVNGEAEYETEGGSQVLATNQMVCPRPILK